MKYLKSSSTKQNTVKSILSQILQLEFFVHRVTEDHFFPTWDAACLPSFLPGEGSLINKIVWALPQPSTFPDYEE